MLVWTANSLKDAVQCYHESVLTPSHGHALMAYGYGTFRKASTQVQGHLSSGDRVSFLQYPRARRGRGKNSWRKKGPIEGITHRVSREKG